MRDASISACFNACFAETYNTVLVGGADEPLYVPHHEACGQAKLFYREDFAASALHETAHWCIAGTQRRTLLDFGYSYQPPPRPQQEQDAFFRLELRVQSLESLFAQAAGIRFQPSADNLQADIASFSVQIEKARAEVERWMWSSADDRARTFFQALLALNQSIANAARSSDGVASG